MNNTRTLETITEDDMNILKKRKVRKQTQDLFKLYITEFPVRREEEPMNEVKEEEVTVKCELCGKTLGYYDKRECGRPLIDGIVCVECKVKCRNYEDAVKASYPDSLQYFVKGAELEDD